MQVTANRVVENLSSLFRFALQFGVVPKSHENPAANIEAYREQGRERFLTSLEVARLGEALRLAETGGLPWIFAACEAPEWVPRDPAPFVHRGAATRNIASEMGTAQYLLKLD
jgi:hypothetical protein